MSLCLTGITFDGILVEGCDLVTIKDDNSQGIESGTTDGSDGSPPEKKENNKSRRN